MVAGHRRSRRLTRFVVLLLLVFAAGVFAVLAWQGNRVVVPDAPVQQVSSSAEQLAQGKYLARAADCVSCHRAPDGSSAFAGGTAVKTPFGDIYGSNITPDPEHGIGRWSAEQFYRAVTLGQAPGGRNLYPAMPYVSYHRMAREDSDLIYGYLMNRPPVPRANRAPDVPFPLNLRVLMSGWNLLFFDKDPLPTASQGESPAWLRGRYMANVMGHCAECHAPRGALGEMKRGDPWLTGQMMEGFLAADLTPEELLRRGWNVHDLGRYLTRGAAPQGVANGEMAKVVQNSGHFLTPGDAWAISVFLLGDAHAQTGQAMKAAPVTPAAENGQHAAAQRNYLALCAGCHGATGQGLPHTMPPLVGNSTLRERDARTLVHILLEGLPAERVPGGISMGSMPGFGSVLDDTEVADLASYLRASWGQDATAVRAQDVAQVRKGD